MQDKNQPESAWYGELYAIHKLKVTAARYLLFSCMETEREYRDAHVACKELGLTDEILLERLKV